MHVYHSKVGRGAGLTRKINENRCQGEPKISPRKTRDANDSVAARAAETQVHKKNVGLDRFSKHANEKESVKRLGLRARIFYLATP